MSWRRLVLLVIALGLALPGLLMAKELPLPKDLPAYGPLKAFKAPEVQPKKLPNGLELWLVPRPGFPKVALAFAMRGGMASDPKDFPGVSELLLATVGQGTKTRNARQIAEEIQAAGGDLTTNAEADGLLISTELLSSKLDGALSVLADVLTKATFPESEVELAKRNLSDTLRAQEADPSFLARRALAKAIFGDHPYSVIAPTQDSIARTTVDVLRREYARRFRPDQTLLVAVGDFQLDRMVGTLQKLLEKWTAPQEEPVPLAPPAPSATPRTAFYVDRPGSVQTTLALGALGPTEGQPDFAATEVANATYGGMFGSRLIQNIREDKGYTYSPGAALQERREAGILRTNAEVRNEVTGASLNEIQYELNRMATTSPSEEEVIRAKRYLVGVRAIAFQAEAAVARQLALLWLRGLPPKELGGESEKIQRITAQEIESAGEKYFPAWRQTVVAVGERKVIQEQLAPLGLEIKPAP